MAETTVALETNLAEYVREQCGENAYLCYQCKKCTAGCPVADEMDYPPNELMRLIQFGEWDKVLNCKTIWICASCEACATRCPMNIEIVRIMDVLKIAAQERKIKPPTTLPLMFNQAALRGIGIFGRMYELGLMAELKIRQTLTGQLELAQLPWDAKLGIKMFAAGKLKLMPHAAHTPKEIGPAQETITDPNTLAIFPGCSFEATAAEYGLSTMAVAKHMGLKLEAPKGWVCCGTTPAHSTSHEMATVMPMRSMALAETQGYTRMTVPCTGCYIRFMSAIHDVQNDSELADQVAQELDGYRYTGQLEVDHLLNTFTEDIGYDAIAAPVVKPLEGLKVVCYYGCVITRPPAITGAPHYEYPMNMDRLVERLGAESLDWSYKTECCGVSLAFSELDIMLKLSQKILQNAKDVGADAIVVACPLCQANLDGRQTQMEARAGEKYNLPIIYFTELMGLAYGLGLKEIGLHKHMVDPRPLLKAKDLLS
ncbi:MAG: 4Fe-4S dicluster domain-containing protein [Chloroflexi bacterium]|nr:4Fe-4S dicluster domain-containing protein [Chloroflexota bacterium]MBU1748588.1 4Fe-4S dicluster domain-containing protein [Chloroflexota bacterium]MBU1879820.1 4Fe-4S dicluster domain-containing protein [Chloroflexota bacterium]